MKRIVNGVPVELETDLPVFASEGRLLIRTPEGTRSAMAVRRGDQVLVSYQGRQWVVERPSFLKAGAAGVLDGQIKSPMPGQVVDVPVAEGDLVKDGDKIVVIEAMKTHQPLVATFDGRVESISVAKGDQVTEGQILAVVVPE